MVLLWRTMEQGRRGGKGPLGELVKAESMIQLAIALPAGCVIGWLVGSWLDKHFHTGWIAITGILLGALGGIYPDIPDGIALFEERPLLMATKARRRMVL